MTADGFIDKYLNLISESGIITLTIAVIFLFLDYYKIFDLSKFPYIPLSLICWIYIFLNVGIATPWHYIQDARRKRMIVPCPQCGGKLKIKNSYSCEACGDIMFEKNHKHKSN
jgi:hypothetical protein